RRIRGLILRFPFNSRGILYRGLLGLLGYRIGKATPTISREHAKPSGVASSIRAISVIRGLELRLRRSRSAQSAVPKSCRSRQFRKWDREIPTTGQQGLRLTGVCLCKPFSFCVKRNVLIGGITHAKGFPRKSRDELSSAPHPIEMNASPLHFPTHEVPNH